MASVEMLIRAGHEVRAFARSAAGFRSRNPDARVEVAEGDILDRAAVAAALEDADAVVHCVDSGATKDGTLGDGRCGTCHGDTAGTTDSDKAYPRSGTVTE